MEKFKRFTLKLTLYLFALLVLPYILLKAFFACIVSLSKWSSSVLVSIERETVDEFMRNNISDIESVSKQVIKNSHKETNEEVEQNEAFVYEQPKITDEEFRAAMKMMYD